LEFSNAILASLDFAIDAGEIAGVVEAGFGPQPGDTSVHGLNALLRRHPQLSTLRSFPFGVCRIFGKRRDVVGVLHEAHSGRRGELWQHKIRRLVAGRGRRRRAAPGEHKLPVGQPPGPGWRDLILARVLQSEAKHLIYGHPLSAAAATDLAP